MDTDKMINRAHEFFKENMLDNCKVLAEAQYQKLKGVKDKESFLLGYVTGCERMFIATALDDAKRYNNTKDLKN